MALVNVKIKRLVLFLVLLVLAVGISYGMMKWISQVKHEKNVIPVVTPSVSMPQRLTLEGIVVCLPHKDTSGPQTMECAFGLKTDDAKHYVLDTGLMSTQLMDYTTGDRIRAIGVVTPIERLSTDHWQKYDVVGIFSVSDSLETINQ